MAQIPFQPSPPGTGQPGYSRYTLALICLGALYFMMGFITCLNDTLIPLFKKGFRLTYMDSALVQFYFFITYGLMAIPAGRIVENVGYKKGMVVGFVVAAAGAFLFVPAALMHEYFLFLGALFVLAIGVVLLQVAANPYITMLGTPETASSRLALIQGVGSAGTTLAPLFGASLILAPSEAASSRALIGPYTGIGLTLLAIALIISVLSLPRVGVQQEAGEHGQPGRRAIFRFRNLRLGVWAIFCYVGAEVSIGSFLTNYISDTLAIPEAEANSFVAFYWGGMLAGRLAGALILKAVRASRVLVFCGLGAVLLITVSILASGSLAAWSMIGVGVFNSVMFATIFSLSVEGLGRYTAQASGILSTAIAGGAVVSFGQGWLADHFDWKIAFMLPALCYVYLIFFGMNGYKSSGK